MKGRILGGILLIAGTSIGGGMLALPMATAQSGMAISSLFFVIIWLITTVAAFYLLEVNLWLPEGAHLVKMARMTLGKPGEVITWVCFLLLLYSLLAAYTAGGADLLGHVFNLAAIQLPSHISAILFVVVFGIILHFGTVAVDMANRALMTIKGLAYLILIILILPYTQMDYLKQGNPALVNSAIMVIVTSFGFANIIPSLTRYLHRDTKALRITVAIGSLIPLLCYLIWDFTVSAAIPSHGPNGLISFSHSPHAVSDLTNALSVHTQSNWIFKCANLFTSICVTTSFLAVSLSLFDFLVDSLKTPRHGWKATFTLSLTLLPPLIIVLFHPALFVLGLMFAGVFSLILLWILPPLMAWSGRYIHHMAHGYKVCGGKLLLIVEMLLILTIAIWGIPYLLK